jgi:hypothetical protein
MFTWICPTCGREVPPSYDECPDCAAKSKAAGQTAEAVAQPEPPPAAAPPPPPPRMFAPPPAYAPPPGVAPPPNQYAAPPQTQYGVPPQAEYGYPPPRAGLPTWLLTILFALAFVGLGAGVYWLAHSSHGSDQASASAPIQDVPAKGTAKEHPLQKYVEVAGIRFTENAKKQTEARFLVVNHSGADITDLAGNVNIWGRTAKSEEEAAGSFNFKVPSLGPYESKEEVAPVNTKLKVYELPDWQNVSAEVQITSP